MLHFRNREFFMLDSGWRNTRLISHLVCRTHMMPVEFPSLLTLVPKDKIKVNEQTTIGAMVLNL